MTEPDAHELLSALLDREPVDPDRLAALLERPDARALLVDFVRLRATLHADAAEPAAVLPRASTPRRPWAGTLLRLAAAIVLVALGALAGRRFATPDVEAPPEPSRVVRLVPNGPTGGAR